MCSSGTVFRNESSRIRNKAEKIEKEEFYSELYSKTYSMRTPTIRLEFVRKKHVSAQQRDVLVAGYKDKLNESLQKLSTNERSPLNIEQIYCIYQTGFYKQSLELNFQCVKFRYFVQHLDRLIFIREDNGIHRWIQEISLGKC